ncbi:hypothetical protein [Actinomadura monticuli]|uniref:Uncharacterized protein n=1 Tax=Actinomadura monticuli TaxID=3097367 RepID=A0ABV4QAM7_9ACTN
MRRAWMIGAAAALVAGLAAPAQAAERPWRTTEAPSGLWPESGLTDVTALSPQEVWAAGFEGHSCVDWSWPFMGAGSICSSNAIVRRWNGASWENRNPPGAWNLEIVDIDASSPENVWLSGGKADQGYLARWDGSRWTQIALPESCASAVYLRLEAVDDGVWASNGCLARWRNGAWTAYDVDAYVHRIDAVSDTELWAGGSRLGPYRSAMLRWDGTEWSEPAVPDGYTDFLAAGPGGVLLSGPGKPELMFRRGGTWEAIPKPPSDYLGYRFGDDGSLWSGADPRGAGALLYRFDGESWQSSPLPARTGTGSRNRGGFDFAPLPATGGGMVAVGTAQGGGPLAMTNQP